jgi:hypothetical protein
MLRVLLVLVLLGRLCRACHEGSVPTRGEWLDATPRYRNVRKAMGMACVGYEPEYAIFTDPGATAAMAAFSERQKLLRELGPLACYLQDMCY